ncbi:MAG: hypothetical protein V4719_20625 [Planctomycetota bacterium]
MLRNVSRVSVWILLAAVAAPAWLALATAEEPASKPLSPEAKAAAQTALGEFNGLIGGWRGSAQPVRNSTKGAWLEKAEWVWDIKKDAVALRYQIKDGQALQDARLTFDPEQKTYHLAATLPDKSAREYTGKLDGKKLVLDSEPDATGFVHRITVTQLNDKRTLVLSEKRPAAGERFTRVVEVGYTREGTNLAVEGAGEPECIVSGGKGTMQVTYKGKTYWVCCSGCRDAFNDAPEGILAEAAERAAKKKKAGKTD